MTIEIDFEGGAEIQHLNVRKEGDQKEILACDVKLSGTVKAAVMCKLLGVDSFEIDHFWRQEHDEFVPRFATMRDIHVTNEFDTCEAKVGTQQFLGVTLKKIALLPLEERKVRLTCSLAISDLNRQDFSYLGECVMEQMDVWIMGQPDLFDNDDNDPRPEDQIDLEDEVLISMARTAVIELTFEGEPITPARIKDKLQIGYNKAARLLETLESLGIVSTINPNGSRSPLIEAA